MTGHVLFIQGAGRGAHDEDSRLAESLRRALGSRFAVHYPAMPDEDDAPYDLWRRRIDQELAGLPGPVVIAGHSVGGSHLLKWLSDRKVRTDVAAVFLIASPFWGGEGWRYEGYEELVLPPGFAAGLPADLPLYLYHCRDDAVVPFGHLALYARDVPQATVRAFDEGGHQLNDDLSAVARDIASLPAFPRPEIAPNQDVAPGKTRPPGGPRI
jgi:predicted alpha/beta hydrolase family esterase